MAVITALPKKGVGNLKSLLSRETMPAIMTHTPQLIRYESPQALVEDVVSTPNNEQIGQRDENESNVGG